MKADSFDAYIRVAIDHLISGNASDKQRVAVLANEAIGRFKNGGFTYLYNSFYDENTLVFDVVAAHTKVNPETKEIYEEFNKLLSNDFFDKNEDDRHEELSVLFDEDSDELTKADIVEKKMFCCVENDFDLLEKWIFSNDGVV